MQSAAGSFPLQEGVAVHTTENSGQARLEGPTFWSAMQAANTSVQPSKMEKRTSSTTLPKGPRREPQRQ